MAKVILENVRKVYPGNIVAVDQANLEIEDREFVVLVGAVRVRKIHNPQNGSRT